MYVLSTCECMCIFYSVYLSISLPVQLHVFFACMHQRESHEPTSSNRKGETNETEAQGGREWENKQERQRRVRGHATKESEIARDREIERERQRAREREGGGGEEMPKMETYLYTKETHVDTKETYIDTKETYVDTKETQVYTKENRVYTRGRDAEDGK